MALEPDFKTDWVAALRSGEYKQARRSLKGWDETYCCLGVAACVLRDKHPGFLRNTGFLVHEEACGLSFRSLSDNSYSCIPTPLAEAIGLADQMYLMHLNDTGHGFYKIADYIEENL